MIQPPHPGETIKEDYLLPNALYRTRRALLTTAFWASRVRFEAKGAVGENHRLRHLRALRTRSAKGLQKHFRGGGHG
jgi:hypothetical protein